MKQLFERMAALLWRGAKLENVALVADEGAVAEGMANAMEIGADGWTQLTIFAEVPHPLGIQRVNRAACERMENSFKSLLGKLKRGFRGVPVYIGHPDVPSRKEEFPDDKAYGWVQELQTREDGLYARIDWSGPGKALVENKHYRFPSPYWDASAAGSRNGKTIFEPHTLLSVGLTNQPRIAVQALANSETINEGNEMNLAIIAALLGLGSTATEAEVTTKINELRGGAGRLSALENSESALKTSLEGEKTAREAAEAKLTGQSETVSKLAQSRVSIAMENAVETGRITPAQKAEWKAKLETNFDLHYAEMQKARSGMKSKTSLENSGSRRGAFGAEQEQAMAQFRKEVVALENSGMNHHDAWLAAKAAHPALYGAMEDSGAGEG